MTDSEKLKSLAKWFDMFDQQGQGDHPANDDVQQDLRRIAHKLNATDRKLKEFFDAIAADWDSDLEIIQDELEQGKRVDVFIRNRRSVVCSKYIRQYWKDYMQ